MLFRPFGKDVLFMSAPAGLDQHIGANRRSRRKSLAASWNCQPSAGLYDGLKGEIRQRQRHPIAVVAFKESDFGDPNAGSELASQRQDRGFTGLPPGGTLEHGPPQRAPSG